MNRSTVLIIGGGIGGLTLALAVARIGRRARVLEKAQEFAEIGAGVQLAPNASHALEAVGVLDAVHTHAVFPKRIVWMDAQSGERLTALDLGPQFIERYGQPYFVMHRHDLLSTLLAACRTNDAIRLETNKDVVELRQRGTETLVRCADGSSYTACAVVGADGLNSVVRAQIAPDEPICSEYVAYRGAIPIDKVSVHAGLDNVVIYTGPNRHFIQYPLRRGELFNQVAVFKSARYRTGSADWGTPDELHAAFARDAAPVRAAMGLIFENRRWPMSDRPPIDRWSRGGLTLMGDAAHPMLQYLAQGAAQALEDAVVLARALESAPDDVELAFSRYERERIPRTSRVQRLARAWGDLWHQPEHALRDTMLRKRAPDDYSQSDWFYGYRPDEVLLGVAR